MPTGKAMLQMICVISELERNLIAERVKEGLEASKKRGEKLGSPKLGIFVHPSKRGRTTHPST